MVWVSFALCQCMGTCIFLGVRISSCVALVLGSTRRIEICGESFPSSGTIVCHFKSSYRVLIACEAPLFVGAPPLLLCPAQSTATNNRRFETPHVLILRRVRIDIGIPFDFEKRETVYAHLARMRCGSRRSENEMSLFPNTARLVVNTQAMAAIVDWSREAIAPG